MENKVYIPCVYIETNHRKFKSTINNFNYIINNYICNANIKLEEDKVTVKGDESFDFLWCNKELIINPKKCIDDQKFKVYKAKINYDNQVDLFKHLEDLITHIKCFKK